MTDSPLPGGARSPRRLREFDLDRYLGDPSRKQHFVTTMFDLVAPRYDRFTRAFSYGMDARWKRSLVRDAARHPARSPLVLDVAAGTGDLAFTLASLRPDARVVAVDAARAMIRRAANAGRRRPLANVTFVASDLMALPIAPESVEVITAGYAFRNTPDHRRALDATYQSLTRGGLLVVLDFYLPPPGPWRALFLGYLKAAGNLYGWAWHREPIAYGYIAESLRRYVSEETFRTHLAEAGFDVLRHDRRLGGGIGLHVARKP